MISKLSFLIPLVISYFILQEFSINFFVFMWIVILMLVVINKKNHFISLLLVLEMLSLRRIIMIGTLRRTSGSLSLIFILMTLRVGEAVLGLAILVKLIR